MSSPLVFPHATPPAGGAFIEVAPGIRWLRMPLPFQLNHINLWLVDDEGGWTVVDTGISNDETRALWRRVFAEALDGRPIVRVICTHFHPDHLGLAGWLCAEWQVGLWATLAEWLTGRMLSLDASHDMIGGQVDFYRRAGFDPALVELVGQRGNVYATRVSPVPSSLRRLRAGEAFAMGGREWRVIVGTGHSPEHACLWCQELDVVISGDQILPRISPNVSVWPNEPDADPLAMFLASLENFREVPESTLVLPSHGLPFRGLAARLGELAHHHDQRLDETVAACARPATAFDLLKILFPRELDVHQTFFAIGESLAHLHYLMGQGRLVRETRADGVWLFRQA